MPGRRRQRQEQFRQSISGGFSYGSLYYALLYCALAELRMALADRQRGVFRSRNNHLAQHAVGSIALLVNGLEAWLNEVIFREGLGEEKIKDIASADVKTKYSGLSKHVSGTKIPVPHRLALVIEVRNEIVHYLPLVATSNTPNPNIPNWFKVLEKQGLFITTRGLNPNWPDFDFAQKLQSYRLAYWAWESVDEAVALLLNAWPSERRGLYDSELETFFRLYKQVCSPEHLPAFDQMYGLEVDS
jgi:hypothetical protein